MHYWLKSRLLAGKEYTYTSGVEESVEEWDSEQFKWLFSKTAYRSG